MYIDEVGHLSAHNRHWIQFSSSIGNTLSVFVKMCIGHTLTHFPQFTHEESMADALSAELVSVDNTPTIDLSGYDLIGFGSAINFAAHDIRLQRFVSEQNIDGKNVFIFSTRCRPFLGAYHKPLKKIIERKGGIIAGEFSCRGFDRTGPWVLMNGYNKARPNELDMFKARLFAKGLHRKLHPLASVHRNLVIGYSDGIPIRHNGADLVFGDKVVFLNASSCVNCGKCVKVCPMHIFTKLQSYSDTTAYDSKNRTFHSLGTF